MQYLQRITTEYEEIEDRFKLTAVSERGHTMSFWLTRRLLMSLSKACINWIENQSPDIAKKATNPQSRDSAQGYAQQSAKEQLREQERVVAEATSPSLLVKEIDVKFAKDGIEIIFKEELESFILALNTRHLRQWLAIVYTLWKKATWSDSHWPRWIATEEAIIVSSDSVH